MAIEVQRPDSSNDARELDLHRTDQRYRTTRALTRYALVGFGLWQGRLAIDALAGHTTSVYVQAILDVFADLRVAILISLTGATTLWALGERRLRHHIIVRLHTRIRELETAKDPHRSSSGLTTKGQTNPTDRDI